jgi:membrane protein implicated in regulation of membrane protease activity
MRTESAAISEAFDVSLWLAWFAELDRTFVFLLVLPLVVAAVGLWAHFREREELREEREDENAARRPSNRAGSVGARREVREG